jgi:DNA-binding response OmpR family regulator
MYSIVLVDDEQDLLESLTRILQREFPHVSIRGTIQPLEAKQWLEQERPTLLITDVRMPEISGLELLSLVSEQWGVVPTIIMTAFASQELDEALKLGTFHYLPKPFRNQEFLRLVRRVLEENKENEPASGFAGTVAVSMLADVVQLHSLAGSTGVLEVSTAKQKGQIFFAKGRIVHAEDGQVEGREAFNHILAWKSGRFAFLRQRVHKETIHVPSSELLIDALRVADEASRPPDDLLSSFTEPSSSALDAIFAEFNPKEKESFKPYLREENERFDPPPLSPDRQEKRKLPTPSQNNLDALPSAPQPPKMQPSSIPIPLPPPAPLSQPLPSPAPLSQPLPSPAPLSQPPALSPPIPPAREESATAEHPSSLHKEKQTAEENQEEKLSIESFLRDRGNYLSSSTIPIHNLDVMLEKLENLSGFMGACVGELKKARVLAFRNQTPIDWEKIMPLHQVFFLQHYALLRRIALHEQLQDIVITSESDFYIVRPCMQYPNLFFCVLLEKQRANLALARMTLAEADQQLVLFLAREDA